MDCFAPSLVLGLGLTRIGCFLAGCCHGEPTGLPWGVSFPAGSQASYNPLCISDGVIPGSVASLPVHPTQIYESMVGFLLFPVAWFLVKKRKFTGQAFLIMIVLYSIARFCLEIIREDSDRGYLFGSATSGISISTSQFIGLVLIAFAVVVYIYRMKLAPAPPVPLDKEQVQQSLIDQGVIKLEKDKDSSKNSDVDPTPEPTGNNPANTKSSKKKKKKKK